MLALLALDATSPALLDELVAAGRLPVLERLREAGVEVPLETPATYFAAATYPTVWSGRELQEHGNYYPFMWSPERQRVVLAADVERPRSVWERLAERGHPCLVVDPYEGHRPARPVHTVLSGWQFTNRVVLERWSSPPSALRDWQRRLGSAPAADEVFGAPSVARLRRLREVLLAGPARAADLVTAALRDRAVELLVVSFSSLHVGGHQFWDPSAVLDGEVPAELRTALHDLYAAADVALGRIVDSLPAGADVIVFSPLGMDRNHSAADLLPGMLDAILGREQPGAGPWRLRAAVPTGLRAAVARAIPDRLALRIAASLELRGTDWSSTPAFAAPSDVHGYVRVNLAGRERDGIVAEEDLAGLLAQIEAGLLTFEDQHGEPLVERVDRTADVLPAGPATGALPDLIVHWRARRAARLTEAVSPAHGRIPRLGLGSGRSGNHTDDAWALVVPGASSPRAAARPHRLTDLAATAEALCGLGTAGEPLLAPR